jgi:hypothetical protein
MQKEIRDRIKEIETEINNFRKDNESILQQGQLLNQKLAQNNTEILKRQGAVEELKRVKD